jgi:leucyl aminopeptidase
VAALKPQINVLGVVPACENMPSGSAYKPGDVIRFWNGKTVEITTTDAEGRMILGDAITYAIRQGADYVIDVATLTGGCVVALGGDIAGIMGNNRDLLENLMESAKLAGEKVWELPLPKDYMDMLKSSIADMTNAGGRYGSPIQGGLFLQEFVEGRPWVHMDIAGPAYTSKDGGASGADIFMSPGATGVGVCTLAILAQRLAQGKM